MSIAHSASSAQPSITYFLMRRLHSLTGIMFGGYLLVHLLVNATLIQQHDIYQTQVSKIHELPMLIAVEWAMIFLPLLYHTIYGIYIIATGQPNIGNYPYGKNWFYLLQRITAVILVLFIAFHVLSLKYAAFGMTSPLTFDAHGASISIARHMHAMGVWAWIVYPIGILASTFHLANGFWSGAITWGLTVSAASQRRWGMVCIGIFLATSALGLIALYATMYGPGAIAVR